MQNKQKLLNLLGLARRAGKLVTGEDMVLGAIRNGKPVWFSLQTMAVQVA